MATRPPEIPTQQNRRPRRGARNRAFDVLLQFFVNAVGADTAVLLKGNGGGRPRMLAAWGRDGDPAVPSVSGSFLGRALRADAQAAIDRSADGDGSPLAVAVATPVRYGQEVTGALYGGFAIAPRLADEELLWTAESYARMAALCIGNGEGLAAVLASSGRDELTGCLDQRSIQEALAAEILRSQRQGHRLSCCFVNLDGLEPLAGSRGQLEATRVLGAVGPALIDSARRYDLVARFDGESFLVMFPETGGRAALQVADRLWAAATGAIGEETGAQVGVSIGVAEWSSGDSAGHLLAAAKEALREATRRGGGRVIVEIPPQRRFDGLVELAKEVVRGKPPAGAEAPAQAGERSARTGP